MREHPADVMRERDALKAQLQSEREVNMNLTGEVAELRKTVEVLTDELELAREALRREIALEQANKQ